MGKWRTGHKAPRVDRKPEIVVTPDEEWRPVAGWEGLYSVSSCGRVRSDRLREGHRLLSQSFKGQDGYLGVRLIRGAQMYTPLTATLVARAFLGDRPVGMQIDHKDGNKLNNRADNLEYVTGRVNHRRAVDLDLHAWGERHGAHKLTADAVRWIRAKRGTVTRDAMAARFKVSRNCIDSVLSGRTWRKLT